MEFTLNIPENYVFYQKPEPIDINNPQDPFDINSYNFNEGQREAVSQILKFVKGELEMDELDKLTGEVVKVKPVAFCLMGYAGTGKTFTVTRLMRQFLQVMKKRVCVTAPTNKAVRILNDNTEFVHDYLSFSTIHRQFAIKPKLNDWTGKEEFVRDYDAEVTIHMQNVLLVDEVSMLDDVLFNYIWEVVQDGRLKVIFIGDPAQIPPVNHKHSIPLVEEQRIKHRIASVTLTEIVRQAAENPILKLAGEVRDNRQSTVFYPNFKTEIVNESGTIVISRAREGEKVHEICKLFFCNQIFYNNPDFMKVIAWTNEVVDAANAKIRTFIYGNEAPDKIMPEERLIVDVPIKIDDNVFIAVNTELKVLNISRGTLRVNAPLIGKSFDAGYYLVKVEYLDGSNYKKEHTCRIIDEHSDPFYKNTVAAITKAAKREQDKYARNAFWREMFAIRDLFAWVKYNYAITAHKSQGSTYDNAMVLDWNMAQNPATEDKNRIRYVAITRPKKYLFIVKS